MALFLARWAGVGAGGTFGAPVSRSEFSLAAISNMVSTLGGWGGLLGWSESPRTMFTRQYSIRAMKTKLKRIKLHYTCYINYGTEYGIFQTQNVFLSLGQQEKSVFKYI